MQNIKSNMSLINKSIYFVIAGLAVICTAIFFSTRITGLCLNNETTASIYNDFNIQNIILNRHPKFQVTEKPELLYGINEITTEVQALGFDAAGKLATRDVTLTLIPYYAWAHRGEGKMDVWLPVNRIDVE